MSEEVNTILKRTRDQEKLDEAYNLGCDHGSCGMCDKNPYSQINEPELHFEYNCGFEDGADRLGESDGKD